MFTRNTSSKAGRRMSQSGVAAYPGGSASMTSRLINTRRLHLSRPIYLSYNSTPVKYAYQTSERPTISPRKRGRSAISISQASRG
jgi:hypothetical protein